jgi:hypothetical protein
MKLELKHLAPYLPYDVVYTHKYLDLKVTYGELDTHNIMELMNPSTNHCIILRPLSDLNTKYGEDEVNKHSINLLIEEKYKVDYGIFSHYKGFLNIELDGDYDLRYDSNKSIDFNIIFEIQEQLFKNHFDVFGLIEKGLAIDINTL